MNYSETIDYLYTKLPLFTRIGSIAFKKDLTNITILCKRLGNPHLQFKSIHVGGTNGKGSVSHMLAAVLQTAGYKTGLHTSPHLYDFRERIKINGEVVPEDFVIDFVERIKPVIEAIEPSFFEITVAMAFAYFARQKVDIAIIEVGLGGRLDSTNIITPALCVITNIGWDHMNMLGNSLKEIAQEKAGIIKENVPVVIGEKNPETAFVFETTADKKKAPLFFAEDQYAVTEYNSSDFILNLSVLNKINKTVSEFNLDLPGIYQTKNSITVLQTIALLKDFNITTTDIKKGLENTKALTKLHGRWEIIHQKPAVILEVAHNKEGIEQMLHHLKKINYQTVHIITGMVKDKDAHKILELLPKEARYYFTQAHIPRALPAAELQQKAKLFSLTGTVYGHVNAALQQALISAHKNDVILICGSIFLVAEIDRSLMKIAD